MRMLVFLHLCMQLSIASFYDVQVEQEEEYLVNNLQRRLAKVCSACLLCDDCSLHMRASCHVKGSTMQVNEEKASLESRLTTEQEYLDNQLQKKVNCVQQLCIWQPYILYSVLCCMQVELFKRTHSLVSCLFVIKLQR